MATPVPASRIRALNDHPTRPDGDFVLYWMTSARRTRSNFGLQRAVELAAGLRRPLVVLEALRCDYPWANDRIHAFILQGMAANARALARRPVLYHPYVEPAAGEGRGLVRALGERACAIVTDWHPGFFLPRMAAAAARQVSVRLEAVDSNGVIPLADHLRPFPTARGYRAFMQRSLREHLQQFPDDDPLHAIARGPALEALPAPILARWPATEAAVLEGTAATLSSLPIDHAVPPVVMRGGSNAAERVLRAFVERRLSAYAVDHHHPDADGTSHLSPYLHFGHISPHEIFSAVMTHERWTTRRLAGASGVRNADRPAGSAAPARGARAGWWGLDPSAEAFLDQLLVWREVAFNAAEW
ncbi:MAG: deoxyribodipyrimidine photolyase, partial [Acidobacteriota bacterium]